MSVLIGGYWHEQFEFDPFPSALETSQEFPPLIAKVCLPLFEHFAKRGIDQLQEVILERLHNHSFYNMGENTLGWNKNNTS
jgi:hypothetical protein